MQVLDFDDFIQEQKIIKLGGKEFDVTMIPFDVALRFNEAMPILNLISEGEGITEDQKEQLLKLIFLVFQLSDPELDYGWFRKQVTFNKFFKIVQTLTESMFDEGKKKEVQESPTE